MMWMRQNSGLVALLAASLCIYVIMSVWTLPQITAAAGGRVPFDLRAGGYDLAAAQDFLTHLSDQGRWIYTRPHRVLDGLFPLLFAATLIGAAIAALAPGRVRSLLIAIIAAGMMADYLENIRVAMLLGGMQVDADLDSDLVEAASRMTQAKFVFDGLALIGICMALLGRVIKKRKVG